MALNNVSELSETPASNPDLAGISILGTGLVSTADDSFRTAASFLKKWWDDLGGVNTVAGTGDAITVTTLTVYTAYKTGMRLVWIQGSANTTAVTLNLDAIGAKAVRKISGGTDVALVAGDLPAGARIEAIYSTAANAAAGGLVILSVSVAAATTSAAGIVQLATLTEAATLTNSTKAVTPSDLTFLGGYATTVTAAGTTTLTVTDVYSQYFTGTTTQTVVLPVTSNLVLGRSYRIVNNSTGAVTVQSSGANTIKVMGGTGITLAPGAPGTELIVTCILTSGTGTASWDYEYRTPTTDWVAYTPTFTGFGTVTAISMFSRRVGDTLEVQGNFTCGTSTAVEARMTVGFNGTSANVTSDATKVANIRVAGFGAGSAADANQRYLLIEQSVTYFTFGTQGAGVAGTAKRNGSDFATGTLSYHGWVPISGW